MKPSIAYCRFGETKGDTIRCPSACGCGPSSGSTKYSPSALIALAIILGAVIGTCALMWLAHWLIG